jgi:hypothetical protein
VALLSPAPEQVAEMNQPWGHLQENERANEELPRIRFSDHVQHVPLRGYPPSEHQETRFRLKLPPTPRC